MLSATKLVLSKKASIIHILRTEACYVGYAKSTSKRGLTWSVRCCFLDGYPLLYSRLVKTNVTTIGPLMLVQKLSPPYHQNLNSRVYHDICFFFFLSNDPLTNSNDEKRSQLDLSQLRNLRYRCNSSQLARHFHLVAYGVLPYGMVIHKPLAH